TSTLTTTTTTTSSGVTVAGVAGVSGANLSLLNGPIALHLDTLNNIMYIGEQTNSRVLKWPVGSSTGTIFAGDNGNGCNFNQFGNVAGLAMDSFGNMYTSDPGCDLVLQFPPNSDSTTSGTLKMSGHTAPEHIFLDPSTNDLYMAMGGEHSVLKLAYNNNTPVIVAGGNGASNGLNQLNQPNSVYYDSVTGNLYVADTNNHRIMKFPPGSTQSSNGVVVAGNNIAGNGTNQLNGPRDVIVDKSGNIYIADGSNNRIQRWLPSAGSGDTIIGSAAGASGTTANLLNGPETLRFDSDNSLFVVDRSNDRVQVFSLLSC
ncbi:unnamed protein product, partial [Didymodactylos carnosus]